VADGRRAAGVREHGARAASKVRSCGVSAAAASSRTPLRSPTLTISARPGSIIRDERKEPSEMKGIRSLALAGATTVVLSAAIASSAAAAPPEWVGPFPTPFTSKSGVTTLETVKKAVIRCTSDVGGGEVTGPNTATIKITFSGCELVTLGLVCNTVGVPPGEIVTTTLVATLGYINAPKKEVGVDLSTATGGPLMEFVCGGLRVIVDGSVIGKITPVNKPVNPPGHFALRFTQAGGKQKPPKFEGGPTDVLSTSFGGPFAESGLSSPEEVSFPIPFMIVA
jgi:hypothetical protein